MPRSRLSASTVALLGAILAALAGCDRAANDQAATPAPEAAPLAETAPPSDTAATRTPAPDEPLQAYVWNCDDGQTLRMRNLLREDAITIEMHEGGRKLPRAVSASGARYSDGPLTFWTKGDTALLERQGSAPVNCRENRFESLLADARVRGVTLRGTGNEPGWSIEIGPGSRLEFVTNYGQERHAFDTTAEGNEAGARVYSAAEGERSIKVTVSAETCTDDMSGWSFDRRMVVEFAGQTYRGCATALP
jgi:membrane-bound inhibitor of C-type lysozyme